jgi:hypothetical protein
LPPGFPTTLISSLERRGEPEPPFNLTMMPVDRVLILPGDVQRICAAQLERGQFDPQALARELDEKKLERTSRSRCRSRPRRRTAASVTRARHAMMRPWRELRQSCPTPVHSMARAHIVSRSWRAPGS